MFTWMGSVRSAGSALCPRVIFVHQYLEYHIDTGIIIGTRTARVLYDTGATYDTTALGGCRSWCLPMKLPSKQCPTPQTYNHVELKQGMSISVADVGGRSSSSSVTEDIIRQRAARKFLCRSWSRYDRVIFAAHVCVPLCNLYITRSCAHD